MKADERSGETNLAHFRSIVVRGFAFGFNSNALGMKGADF
jgi:hypothetical protein